MTEKSVGRGTVLAGRYRLEDLVQETDGARFWRATDQILARSVAVNVISADDPRAEAVLVAARTSATVTDGHFLRVLDAAEEDGFVYVVNEWGLGVSLDKLLSSGPLPPRRAAWLVKEVAEAISTAHAHGIAHGRLLPENVMVTEAGSVKLIGFVVDAVLHGRQEAVGGEEPLSDHEADVRNLAALLYVTLVGRWPGSPGTALPEAPRDHGRPLRPRQVRAGVPRPLDAVCDRVLTPGGGAHHVPIETAHEICAALSDFIGDPAGLGQAGVVEPTQVLARDLLATGSSEAPPAGAPGAAAGTATGAPAGAPADTPGGTPETEAGPVSRGPVDPEATQAVPLPDRLPEPDAGAGPGSRPGSGPGSHSGPDPEATQAAAPVFDEADLEKRTPPPPPPPFPPQEPKPLFAPGPPRPRPDLERADAGSVPDGRNDESTSVTAGAAPAGAAWPGGEGGPGSSHGTGSLPPVWGPDPEPEPEPRLPDRPPGMTWLKLSAVLAACLVLVVAAVIAFDLGRDTEGGPVAEEPTQSPGQSEGGRPLPINNVFDFDPQGDPPEENPELSRLAADGDPSTAWRTMTYYNNPKLGLLKDGVGLVVDLGEPREVSAVELTMAGRPTSLELLAAPDAEQPPESVDGLEQVASADDAGPQTTLKLDEPVTTRYLVVWLTSLPPISGGFQGRIAEITVRP